MTTVQSPAVDAVIAWLRDHQDVAGQVQALGDAQRNVMDLLDGLVPDGERRRQRHACTDHLWCGVRAAVAAAIHAPDPADVAAEVVIAARRRDGRAHVADVAVRVAAEAVYDASLNLPFASDHVSLRRGLAILALLNCPNPSRHPEVARAALNETS